MIHVSCYTVYVHDYRHGPILYLMISQCKYVYIRYCIFSNKRTNSSPVVRDLVPVRPREDVGLVKGFDLGSSVSISSSLNS